MILFSIALIGTNVAWYRRYNDRDDVVTQSITSLREIRKMAVECLQEGGTPVLMPDPEDKNAVYGSCMKITIKYGEENTAK